MTLFGRRFSGLALALLVSLCLNAFALAAFASHWVGDKPRRPEGRQFDRLVHGAPEAMRPAMRAGLEARRPELDGRFAALREARAQVGRLLKSPDLDRAGLENALGALRERQMSFQEILHGAMLESLAKAPPDARAAWAERWNNDRRP